MVRVQAIGGKTQSTPGGSAPGRARLGPELTGLGTRSSTGIVVWSANSFGRYLSLPRRRSCNGRRWKAACPPVRQSRTIELNTLAGVNLHLPTERQVIGIFSHQNLGVASVGSPPFINRVGAGAVHDTVFASTAGVFGTPASLVRSGTAPGLGPAARFYPRQSDVTRPGSRDKVLSRYRRRPRSAARASARRHGCRGA